MEELYNKYSNLVYNYLKNLCEDRELAEELTQETFYKAIKGIKGFRGQCKASSWLCQIAKNVWKDYIKENNKINSVSLDDNYIENLIMDKDIEDNLENENSIIQLYKAIHKLDEITKEVFYLRIKGELSFKEIGVILDKSEDWARITFYRGKIKLKEELNNDRK